MGIICSYTDIVLRLRVFISKKLSAGNFYFKSRVAKAIRRVFVFQENASKLLDVSPSVSTTVDSPDSSLMYI